jgi:hypothetical protein
MQQDICEPRFDDDEARHRTVNSWRARLSCSAEPGLGSRKCFFWELLRHRHKTEGMGLGVGWH